MSERQKETKFLKTLILSDDSDQARELQARIQRAEKDEKCIRGAVYMVAVVALLSLSGLGYSAVLVPEFARFSSHIATRICCVLGLGSVLCMMIFGGYWFWFRAVSNRRYEECRRFLRPLLEARIKQTSVSDAAPLIKPESLPVYQTETRRSQDDTDFLQLSKAS